MHTLRTSTTGPSLVNEEHLQTHQGGRLRVALRKVQLGLHIGIQIEEPFATLPLTPLCATIERDVSIAVADVDVADVIAR